MKTLQFQSKEDWLAFRKGKISGTRLKDIIVKRGTGKKKGYYELIAERLAVAPTEEDVMERGNRLQAEATERFAKETEKPVDGGLVMWIREDNESIAISPDGVISPTEALEIKCLSSASHLEAYLTQEVPTEYKEQIIQYFIVNDTLTTLYMCFYDPRVPCKDFFYLTIMRESVQKEVAEYLEYQKVVLREIDEIVLKLSGF
ncbi:MAG: YqaJ viral recombinase family protein [Patescibacteria group bacterium]|nr:YqaJ viral recombinase family protein [Patescibacteria group bacterium]